jgi:RNA polymerase sigma factor (sigma-70 family)
MVSPAHPLFRQLNGRDSDRELLERFVGSGDQDAFALLVDRHGPLVQRVCRRVLGDAHLADDAFQATFLLLARKAASLSNADAVGSWLFGVARRMSLATRRQRGRETVPLTQDLDTPVPEERREADTLLVILEEELARMPDHLRAPLIACYLQGQTQDEAALALGWSLSTLRRRLEEGRELLRSRLATRGSSLPACLLAGALLPALQPVPATLRAVLLALVAGGPVPASVATLLALGGTSTWLLKSVLIVAGFLVLLGLGYAATRLAVPPAPQPVALPEPGPEAPGGAFHAWVDPLPASAVTRLGTTAFRHGTGGYFRGGMPEGLAGVGFQPDGTIVSVGGERVRFWEPQTGRELHRDRAILTPRAGPQYMHLLPAAGQLIVPESDEAGFPQPVFTLWDLQEGRPQRNVRLAAEPVDPRVFGVSAVAAGGQAYAVLDHITQGVARIWHADGSLRSRLDAHFDRNDRIFLTPDGGTAITVEVSQRIRTWDTFTGKMRRQFGGGLGVPAAALLSPDGRWLAIAGKNRDLNPVVRLWDLSGEPSMSELLWPDLAGWPGTYAHLAFSADSGTLAAAAYLAGRPLHFATWSLPGEEAVFWQAPVRSCPPTSLAIDPQRHRLVMGGFSVLRLFDSTSGQELTPTDTHITGLRAVEFSPEGDRVISTDRSEEVREWDAATGQLLHVRPADPPVGGPSVDFPRFDLDIYTMLGARPGSGIPFGTITRKSFPMTAPQLIARTFDRSPDGKCLALTFAEEPPTRKEVSRIVLLDLATRQVRWELRTAEPPSMAVCFSPDGKRLAVGTTKVLLLDAATGATQTTFQGHRGAISALAFRADGRRLASASTDTTVLIWDCPAD